MERPNITTYQDLPGYVRDMLRFRKHAEPGFSVLKATKQLRRVSPALVSLVVRSKRKLSLDRVEEFSKLLALNSAEKVYFRNWLQQKETPSGARAADSAPAARKNVSPSLLNDWINVYVKDFFMLPAVQRDPSLIERFFAGVASPARVKKSIEFLLREGHLRRTLNGRITIEAKLAVADPGVPTSKIRQFHKAALTLARQALDLYPPADRLANTLILPLDERRHAEIRELISDFAERLKEFADNGTDSGDRLYQVLLNVSPVGGSLP